MQIILKDLVKKYGDLVAVDVPHLEIPTGQVVGLVGNIGQLVAVLQMSGMLIPAAISLALTNLRLQEAPGRFRTDVRVRFP